MLRKMNGRYLVSLLLGLLLVFGIYIHTQLKSKIAEVQSLCTIDLS